MHERRAAILRAVVEEYVETATPVGSGHVAQRGGVGSPATVRNDMVALEHDGYLFQPHTSAGRVPTDKGYRFFVDTVVAPGQLTTGQRQEIRDVFARAHGALEETLRDASTLLTRLTDCTAVVVGPPQGAATVRSVQVVGLAPRTALVVVVLSNGQVEKAAIELSDEAGEDRLAAAARLLNAGLLGTTLVAAPVLPPTDDVAVEAVASAAVRALQTTSGAEPDRIFVGGASRVAAAFSAAETVRGVLTLLEQQYVLVGLLRQVLEVRSDGPSVAIGTESGVDALSQCALVVAPYAGEGSSLGSVAVLGPTRMHYPETMAAVTAVSARLARWLATG